MNATVAPNWWRRNLKWVIAGAVLFCLALLAASVAAVLFFVSSAMRSNDVHRTAMARVNAHPEAVARLGSPIEAGFLASGSIEVNPRSGHADLGIPVSGPRGEGRISVLATKRAGAWTFEVLQLETAGAQPLELRTPEQIDAAEEER